MNENFTLKPTFRSAWKLLLLQFAISLIAPDVSVANANGVPSVDAKIAVKVVNASFEKPLQESASVTGTVMDAATQQPIPRWNTLLRMGGTVAVDRIRAYAYWPEAAATLTFDYNLWPIPQTVIATNKDVNLEQNPGWNR